jgi:putative phage-type endonuclease
MNAPLPGTAEWMKIVTASKVAAIIGVSPWESPRSMWRTMRGEMPPVEVTDAMLRGTLLEDGVLAWWQMKHPEYPVCVPQFWATRPEYPWAAATPDMRAIRRTDSGPDVVLVDAKTASRVDDWGTPGTDEIPDHYLTSSYWQLAMCPEASRVYIALLGPYLEFSEYVVERNDEIQNDLIARCLAFYESLSAGIPPMLDDSVSTYNTVKAEHPDIEPKSSIELAGPLAYEYVESAVALEHAESRARFAKTAVLDAMGSTRLATLGGTTIARRQPYKHGVSLVRVAKNIPDRLTAGVAA